MAKYGTGATVPSSAKASDGGGEKTGTLRNGVAMGKQDGNPRSSGGHERGEFNTGRSDSVCYNHKSEDYSK